MFATVTFLSAPSWFPSLALRTKAWRSPRQNEESNCMGVTPMASASVRRTIGKKKHPKHENWKHVQRCATRLVVVLRVVLEVAVLCRRWPHRCPSTPPPLPPPPRLRSRCANCWALLALDENVRDFQTSGHRWETRVRQARQARQGLMEDQACPWILLPRLVPTFHFISTRNVHLVPIEW